MNTLLDTYSPSLFGVPIFNRFNPETYKESINWLIDSGATGRFHTYEGLVSSNSHEFFLSWAFV